MSLISGLTRIVILLFLPAVTSCNQNIKQYKMGTYGYDLALILKALFDIEIGVFLNKF